MKREITSKEIKVESGEGKGHVSNTVDEFVGIGERTRIRKIDFTLVQVFG